jgi:hypothetical protein
MSSAMSKGILWGVSPGPGEYSLSWELGQRIFYSEPQARGHSFHGLLGIPKMPTASVIPLHQKLLGGTVKAFIHHPTDFAGVQLDVLCNFVVLYFTGQKNLICVCVCVCCVLLFTCKFEPMTRALFEQVQRDRRVVFDSAKDTPSPESWKLPQTTPTDFAVFSEMSYGTFSFCTLQDIVYIFVLLFTCKFEPMTRAIFDQVQRDLRVVFEGPVWDATLIPAKFLGALKWPASWHPKPKSCRSMWLQGSNCREPIVNRISVKL